MSARYVFYEGCRATKPHFSDRDVLLYDTMDQSVYGLGAEKIRMAFRAAYSILDKAAFLLNDYLRLATDETGLRKVTFRTLWYEGHDRKKPLKRKVLEHSCWTLRGLFWLSKDLFEDADGFRDNVEPDAQALHEIRRYLEHRYLRLVGVPVGLEQRDTGDLYETTADGLALSVRLSEIVSKTRRLLKLVRAALVYLSLSIHFEERKRAEDRSPDAIIPPVRLGKYEDEWKR